MALSLKFGVNINTDKLARQFEALADDKCMYQIHNEFARLMDPFVPYATGTLAEKTVQITKEKVIYTQPYARYQYMGELYVAPNGSAWAHKDEKKHGTGIPLNYNKEFHQKASKEWDKAMMSERGEEFLKHVADILLQRCKELYG